MHGLLVLVVIAHGVDGLERLAARPRRRDLEARQEALLLLLLALEAAIIAVKRSKPYS